MTSALRIDIQVIRGIAVLMVILFHADESLFPHGYLGVDVFFVVSGYVITPRLLEIFSDSRVRNSSVIHEVKTFFTRRFFRLIPALISTLATTGLLLFFLAPFEDQKRIGMQGVSTLFGLGNLGAYKFSGNYFTPNPNPLVHTWSLSIEEQIYLLLPLIMVAWRLVLKRSFVELFAWIACLSLAIFSIPSLETRIHNLSGYALEGFGFYSPLSRVWQFAAGGLLYLLTLQSAKTKDSKSTRLHFLSILTFLVVLFLPVVLDHRIMSFLMVIATLPILHLGSFQFLPKKLVNTLKNLGDQSYSTYLIHMPLIYLAKFSPLFGWGVDKGRSISIFFAFVITMVLGRQSYVHIEQKFRNGNHQDNKRSKKIVTWMAITISLFVMMFESAQKGWFAEIKFGMNSEASSMAWYPECNFLDPKNTICKFDNSGKKTVLLIGDSQGASISSTLVELGQEFEFNVAIGTKASCPFLLEKATWKEVTNECISHNENIRAFVRKNRVDAIVYFQRRISVIYENTNLNRDTARTMTIDYGKRILDNLSELEIEPTRLVVLGFAPEVSKEPTRLGFLLGERSQYIAQSGLDNELWKSMLRDRSITYVDIYKAICPNGICISKSTEGHRWILQDFQHLSLEGARLLKEPIQEKLVSNLRS